MCCLANDYAIAAERNTLKKTTDTPDWLWSIVVEFNTLASGREEEVQKRIHAWLASVTERIQAKKKALPKREENSVKGRQVEREAGEQWNAETPIPKDVIASREVARLAAASDAVMSVTPLERTEAAGWKRMAPPSCTLVEQTAWCLLFPSAPRDWPAWKRDLEVSSELVGRLWPESHKEKAAKNTDPENNAKMTMALTIMNEHGITRPQAVKIVRAMVNMGATSLESAKPEIEIKKKAGVGSRIVSVFSEGAGKNGKRYDDFRKRYIKNTGTRKKLYYLKLS